MKVLKGFALGIMSFLLFISLSAFGLAFLLNTTALNARFVSSELERLDVSLLVDEATSRQSPDSGLPPEVRTALVQTVDRLEPQIKQEVSAAISTIYDYLKGKTRSLDLALVLKDTVLKKEFLASLVKEADVTSILEPYLREKLTAAVRPDQQYLVKYLDEALPQLEPWIEAQADTAIGPIVDYLLGESQTLRVAIALEPMKTILRTATREAFLRSPPPELATASPAELDRYFNDYYQRFAAEIPPTFEIDESDLGIGPSVSLAEGLADAETALAQAKKVIGYFRGAYILLIIFMLLLIAGIILIHRSVKGATRELGIVFLTYGALEYIGILVTKYIVRPELIITNLPQSLQSWLPGFVANFLRPLEMLSLGLAIGGIALIVVSFVYRPRPVLP